MIHLLNAVAKSFDRRENQNIVLDSKDIQSTLPI
jgi:hypothetical protein